MVEIEKYLDEPAQTHQKELFYPNSNSFCIHPIKHHNIASNTASPYDSEIVDRTSSFVRVYSPTVATISLYVSAHLLTRLFHEYDRLSRNSQHKLKNYFVVMWLYFQHYLFSEDLVSWRPIPQPPKHFFKTRAPYKHTARSIKFHSAKSVKSYSHFTTHIPYLFNFGAINSVSALFQLRSMLPALARIFITMY